MLAEHRDRGFLQTLTDGADASSRKHNIGQSCSIFCTISLTLYVTHRKQYSILLSGIKCATSTESSMCVFRNTRIILYSFRVVLTIKRDSLRSLYDPQDGDFP